MTEDFGIPALTVPRKTGFQFGESTGSCAGRESGTISFSRREKDSPASASKTISKTCILHTS